MAQRKFNNKSLRYITIPFLLLFGLFISVGLYFFTISVSMFTIIIVLVVFFSLSSLLAWSIVLVPIIKIEGYKVLIPLSMPLIISTFFLIFSINTYLNGVFKYEGQCQVIVTHTRNTSSRSGGNYTVYRSYAVLEDDAKSSVSISKKHFVLLTGEKDYPQLSVNSYETFDCNGRKKIFYIDPVITWLRGIEVQ